MLQKFHAGSNSDSGVQYRSMIQMHMILWCRPSIRLLAVLALCLAPRKTHKHRYTIVCFTTFPAFRQSDGLDHTSTGCRTLSTNCGKQLASRASALFWVLRNSFAPPFFPVGVLNSQGRTNGHQELLGSTLIMLIKVFFNDRCVEPGHSSLLTTHPISLST